MAEIDAGVTTSAGGEGRLLAFGDALSLATALAAQVAAWSAEAVEARGRFVVGLSGGSLPAAVARGLADGRGEALGVDFGKWHVVLCDERLVPHGSADSNLRAVREALLDAAGVPPAQVHGVDEALLGDAGAAAARYEEALRAATGAGEGETPVVDALLLGMGPDGHTCSLFPGHALLGEARAAVAPIEDSPKPPPRRVTLTLPVIRAARHVAVVAAGASKVNAFASVLGEASDNPLPAARVAPDSGSLLFFADAAAVAGVTSLPPPDIRCDL